MTTFVDKDRAVTLVGDGVWHPFYIEIDGRILRSAKPEPGRYLLQVQVLGTVLKEPTSNMDVRAERYPYDNEDNGTAWDTIELARRIDHHWFGTFHAIVTVNATGPSSRIGGMYRFEGGKLVCSQRVFKFELLR